MCRLIAHIKKSMMKKLIYSCLSLSILLSINFAHAGEIELKPGISMDFFLEPNVRQEFTNFAFQTVSATCIVATEDKEGNDIFVEVLRKKGKVNDIPLSAGDNVIIHVNNHDNLFIVAESGGKVALTNLSDFKVIAKCVP